MALLTLQGVGFDYGRQTILESANLTIHPGERYGLVGLNGAGKSTLLRLLVAEMKPIRGKIERAGRVRVAMLPQDTVLDSDEPLRDAVRREAFGDLLETERRLHEIGERMGQGEDDPALLEEYGQLHERFETADGYSMDSRCDAALGGLGFGTERLQQPVRTLSGGQKRRAALAAILLATNDLLLLDEPTNHLDLDAREWLESHLAERKTAVVAISHDRTFLDQATSFTLHLMNVRLARYSGGYSQFLRQWQEQKAHWEIQYRRQQEHISKTEAFIRKNIAGQRTNQAKSRRKQLDRLERVEAPPNQGRQLRINLKPSRESGSVVFEGHDLSVRFDDLTLFQSLDFQILRGEKLGVLGPNGTGKSTLLRLLIRELAPTVGRVEHGPNVDLGYFDQELTLVTDGNSVVEEIRLVQPDASDGDVYSILGAFQFPKDMTDQKVRSLSGGERARLSLLKLILERHNVLLMDEPTNHLDVDTREALEDALIRYDGTLIVVSHDRYFLNRICDRIFGFEGSDVGVRQILGNYDDYRRALEVARSERSKVVEAPAPVQPKRKRDLSKNELTKLRREVGDLEENISLLEFELEEIGEQMSSGAEADEIAALGIRAQELRKKIDGQTEKWEELTLLLERDPKR